MGNDIEDGVAVERESAFTGGVNSGVDADLVRDGEVHWAKNMIVRGGKLKTRPAFIERMVLPLGRVQNLDGSKFNSGSLVTSIEGMVRSIRLGDFDIILHTDVPAGDPSIKQVFTVETPDFMIIQDGQRKALIFDGNALRDAASDEVPRGTYMAWGNGRIWVGLTGGRVIAGDIVDGNDYGSELKFTEAQYLLGGGSLSTSGDLTGMKFVPANDRASGFGPLIVFGKTFTTAFRADIVDRSEWATIEGFVSELFPRIGCSGHTSIESVNQDLYWRDGNAGWRSLKQTHSDYETPGSSPLSNEISRVTTHESDELLDEVSSIYYDNRLLMSAHPFFVYGGMVAYKSIVSLDFVQLANMSGKSSAVYDGEWTGFNTTHSTRVYHNGKERVFFVSKDAEGINRLWELDKDARDDVSTDLAGDEVRTRIQQEAEFKRMFFGDPRVTKRLMRMDLWLSNYDDLDVSVYYRVDQTEQWILWDTKNPCTDIENDGTDMTRELRPGTVAQLMTFDVPDDETIVANTFQFKVRFTGRVQLDRMIAYATPLDSEIYAKPVAECAENEIALNELFYEIPVFNVPLEDYVDESADNYVDENGDQYVG